MKVLHLYSDWRWTGPAEPTVNLCRALEYEGVEVLFACRRPLEGHPQAIAKKAMERGLEACTAFHLNRYLNPRETLRDLRSLPEFVDSERIDLIHCHLTHDHFLGGWASRRSKRRPPVIRTNHKARPLDRNFGNRWLLARWTDGLVEFSRLAEAGDTEAFSLQAQQVLRVNPALDLERFDPEGVQKDVRPDLGVKEGDFLVGIVARMQRHRRFDLLLEAMARLKARWDLPPVKLMVLGKGTHRMEVAIAPAREMGLEDRVLFPGYRREDYVDYLAAMDVKVFLVPGSDGTCRAVREAMAMGKPVVATRRGMLSELVREGETGFLVDESPLALEAAIARLAKDPALRTAMGYSARRRALESFSQKEQARRLASFYESLLARV